MAHGFLSYEQVSGESPLWRLLGKGFEKLLEAKIWPLRKKQDAIAVTVSELRDALKAGQTKAFPPAATRMLGGSKPKGLLSPSGALASRVGGIVGKNPTDIDVKTGRRALPPGGPRLPGSAGGTKGGTFTNISGGGGLNAENFFTKAQTGVGDSGEYLTKAQRIADFRKSQEMRAAAGPAPAISPDSGADIVAAVNRNTQMIVSLVEATKQQTSNDSQLVQQQIQAQETMMSRSAARAEENALEQGSDLSGFMTPENFAKKKQQEAKKETGSKLKEIIRGPNPFKQDCGCGIPMPGPGGRPLGGRPRGGGLAIPDYVDPKRKMLGSPSSRIARRGAGRALTRGAAMVGGKAAAKGVAKGMGKMGLKKIPGIGAVAGAAFAAERAMKGDWLGAGGELLSGLAGTIPGIGTGVSAAIDAGLMARDAGLTPFARGGIITQPTAGLVGEAGDEGVFPLEGSRGKKTFRMFGEGIFQAQKDNESDFVKLQSKGLRQYYETEGGFEKMGDIFGRIFGALGQGLGAIVNSLSGAARAGEMPGGGFASADEQQLTEALIAGEEGVRTEAYQDSEGIWTIGYGQTTLNGRAVKKGDKISKEEALSGFRSNVQSHRKRAIDQVGEGRWSQLDPKARAVLTSLAYNYGSIPNAVLPAAKSGSTEDIAASMNALYGHNRGVLKGRRQREQSILRGGTSDRLDKDFLAGGKFAGQGTGPMVYGNQGGSGSASKLAAAAEQLRGTSTNVAETDYGQNGCVYAVNKVYKAAGMTPPWGSSLYVPTAEQQMIKAGYQQVAEGQRRPGDVMVMYDKKSPPQAHIGVVLSNGNVLSNSSSRAAMSWEASPAEYNRRYGGIGKIYRMPGGMDTSTIASTGGNQSQGATASSNTMSPIFQRPAGNSSAPPASAATPSPLFNATAASPNTGTPIMATSAQVAMAGAAPAAAPTVINNYYGSGQQQSGGVNPNGVSPGIGMSETGTSIFQDLKIRSLA